MRTHRLLSPLRAVYACVRQPMAAAVLFVALIYLWLIPTVHFYAMINIGLYNAMN